MKETATAIKSKSRRTVDCQSSVSVVVPTAKQTKMLRIYRYSQLESKFASMSGIMSDLIDQKPLMRRVSKKRDNAPVPVELWLYWLNARISIPLSFDECNSYVTIKEIFLLTRWKRNLMRSYAVWLKEKLADSGVRL